MSICLTILTSLAPNFPASQVVLDQSARINVNQWGLVAKRPGLQEVAAVLDLFPEEISRNDIIGLRHLNPDIRRRRVAIASLMWGYGIFGARWGGQWVSDVSEFLSSGLDAILPDAQEFLAAGEIGRAYRLFTGPGREEMERESYKGVGSSYFTKILYFLARNALQDDKAEYPLILDTKVSMALAQMNGYRLLVRPASYRPRADSWAYAQYVKRMHAWADKLSVLPDVIEYYLWSEAGKPGSALWKACRIQHDLDFP